MSNQPAVSQRSSTRNMRTDASRPSGPGPFSAADQAKSLGGTFSPSARRQSWQGHGQDQAQAQMQTQTQTQTPAPTRVPTALDYNYAVGGFDAVKNNTPDWYDMPSWMRTQILAGLHDRS